MRSFSEYHIKLMLTLHFKKLLLLVVIAHFSEKKSKMLNFHGEVESKHKFHLFYQKLGEMLKKDKSK